MSGKLTQDFDAHVARFRSRFPTLRCLRTGQRAKRWFFIAFAESWLAVFLFRLKKRLRGSHVPALPVVCDLISRALFHVSINAVEVGPGS